MNVVFTPTAWQQYTDGHRLVYNMDSNQNLLIYSCKGHYED